MSKQSDKTKGLIVIVDDEPGMRVALTEVLARAGWKSEAFESGESALEFLRTAQHVDLLMTDFRMGGMTGLELTHKAKEIRPQLPIVMMTAYGTVEDAVTAMKEGVDDYLLKPFSFDTVVSVVTSITSRDGTADAAGASRAPAQRKPGAGGGRAVIGEHPTWKRAVQMADEVADSDATVLLTGESGTGKEVLARRIHELSGRRGSFIAINCAALPEGVLESELFGHEKGAFTGAFQTRKGRFELAQGGTILLDEVSEMPLPLQAKLLRVLQEREISPVGGTESIKLDIRVIATTNRNIEEFVRQGNFRQDLYYRLNVISLRLPSLCERPTDIPLLARHFLAKYLREGRPAERFAGEIDNFLMAHSWPGNVRELENVIERACLLARQSEIQARDLHLRQCDDFASTDEGRSESAPGDFESGAGFFGKTLEEMERKMILATLDRTGGNRTKTAEMLGVSVRTIRNKLNQYNLTESAAGL